MDWIDPLWAIDEAAVPQISAAMDKITAGPGEPTPIERAGDTAVVRIRGPMTKGRTFFSAIFGGNSMTEVRAQVRAAANDSEVRRIMLLIDSPGGSVDGLFDLMEDVRAVARRKEIIAQVDGQATSAAWFVASQATTIRAGKTDRLGSVGLRMMLMDFSASFEKDGVRAIPIDTGPFKSAGAPGLKVTDEHIAAFQAVVDRTFRELSALVMKSRGLSEEDFEKIADGRLHVGQDAVKLGLADGLSTVERTLASFHQEEMRRRRRRAADARLGLLTKI